MAAIQSYYEGGTRDVGPSALVGALGAFLDTRYAMNQAAYEDARVGDEDLADTELQARETLGRMQEALAKTRSGDARSQSSLIEEILRATTNLEVANVNAGARIGVAKLATKVAYRKIADAEAAVLEDKIRLRPETTALMANLGTSAAQGGGDDDEVAERMYAQFVNLMAREGPGRYGDAKYDAAVRDAAHSAANPEVAKRFTKLATGGVEEDADKAFVHLHKRESIAEAEAAGDRAARRVGSGTNPSAFVGDILRQYADVGGTDGYEILQSGAAEAGGSGAPAAGGGSRGVTIRGDVSPAAYRALASDPYAGLQAAIAAQAAYVDQLAKERADQKAKQRGRFPRANPYLANPNEVVGPRDVEALRRLGQNDPGLNEAWASALAHNDGNVERARLELARGGGVEARFAPKPVLPMQVVGGGNLGDYLAEAFEAADEREGPGGWRYRFNPDQSITVTAAPTGHKAGGTIRTTDPAYDAITREVGPAKRTAAMVVLSKQPREVQALFGPRVVQDQNPAAARAVDPGDVRRAYGEALVRASKNPQDVEPLYEAMSALPDEVRGDWYRRYGSILSEYGKTWRSGGVLASSAASASIRDLGLAMIKTGPGRRDWRGDTLRGEMEDFSAEQRAEWEEEYADRGKREAYDRGRKAALDAWGELSSSPWGDPAAEARKQAIIAGWEAAHKAAPSDMTQGAIDALADMERGGKAAEVMRHTGRLPMETTVDMGPTVVQTGRKMAPEARVGTPDAALEPVPVTDLATARGSEDDLDAALGLTAAERPAVPTTKPAPKPSAEDDLDAALLRGRGAP